MPASADLASSPSQCDERHLWGAVHAHWDPWSPQTNVGVQGQLSHLVAAPRILPGIIWEPGCADAGNPDLAAMGMSGQLQIYRISDRLIGEIRFVHQQNRRLIFRNFLEGNVDVWPCVQGIQPAEPQSLATTFDRMRIIAQDRNILSLQSLGYHVRIRIDIMVP